MSKAHRSCLLEWIHYNGSNRCEICKADFADVPPQPERTTHNQQQALQILTWELERSRPFTRRKRLMLGSTIMMLVLVTCLMCGVTVSAERSIIRNDFKMDDYNSLFSICAGFMFFCLTMAAGLTGMWVMMECCYYIYRRRILRHAHRFAQNANV
ncbi:hypothetical protein ScPMuIL_009207 [Solemya velum]